MHLSIFQAFLCVLSAHVDIHDFPLLLKVSNVSQSHTNVESYFELLRKCIGLKMIRQTISTKFDVHQVSDMTGNKQPSKQHMAMHMFARLARTGILRFNGLSCGS